MTEYQIQWTCGMAWGIVYVNAKSEAAAKVQVRKTLPLSPTAKRFATIIAC